MTGNETAGTSLPQIFIIATATTPDPHPLNRCSALYKIQDASATRTHHPKIRFMARRRIADDFGFGHAFSTSLRSALTSPRLATTAHQSLLRYGLRASSVSHDTSSSTQSVPTSSVDRCYATCLTPLRHGTSACFFRDVPTSKRKTRQASNPFRRGVAGCAAASPASPAFTLSAPVDLRETHCACA